MFSFLLQFSIYNPVIHKNKSETGIKKEINGANLIQLEYPLTEIFRALLNMNINRLFFNWYWINVV